MLVTGATGFTGAHLCRHLVERGETVSAFVRSSSRTDELVRLGVDCRVVDIRDRNQVAKSFDEFTAVYHIAAAYRVEHADLEEFRRVNVDATRNLLEAAAGAAVRRFVHCSTVGVQGHIEDPPANEEYRFAPGDNYQRSKLEGELLAREYAAKGLAVSIVRPAAIYGPGDRRFLKLFRAIARRRFVMVGDGRTLYHLVYVEDLVRGILLAGSRPEAIGEVCTIAGDRYTTLQELVEIVAETLGAPKPWLRVPYAPVYVASVICQRACQLVGINPPLYPRRAEFFVKSRAFDISKARRLLGYEPTVKLEDGLAKTAAWYRQQGLL
ncbi:MAG: NAD-dependent epimerase/dehydratase family protein [Acidobacteriota bacterium]